MPRSCRTIGLILHLEAEGHCHGNSIGHAVRAEIRHASCRCDGTSPLCGSFCSEDPQCGSGDEVALQVEGVVNRSVHAEKGHCQLSGPSAPFSGPTRL